MDSRTGSMTQPAGLFVTIEGGEGCGKTTLARALEGDLGPRALFTREPGGTSLGRSLRALLLAGPAADSSLQPPKVGSLAELLLFLADRAQHVEETIEPALSEGRVVVCDRFADSTLVYQGWARRGGLEGLLEVDKVAVATGLGRLVPDLTILLDAPPEVGLARARAAKKGSDRIEAESLAFHREIRAGFLKLAEFSPKRFVVLDATRPADELAEAALKAITAKWAEPPETEASEGSP